MKSPKRALIQSVFALILCLSMLVGTTYAWFTDTETSMNNLIVAGNLDIEMYWNTDMSDNWKPVDNDAIFDYDRWEPGYTEVRYVKIVNEGNLSLKYLMKLYPLGEVGTLADVIDVYYVESPTAPIGGRDELAALAPIGVLSDVINELFNTEGKMDPRESIVIGIALKMRESAGNEYKKASVGDSFTIQLMATQLANESDAFGNSYDSESKYPAELINERVSAPVENENGAVKNDTPINGRQASAIIPAGVELEEGVDTLTLNATEVSSSTNITLNDGQEERSVDVHIDGVSKNNTIPMPITLPAFTYAGLNAGNVNMVHIEDDVNVSMTPVDSIADLATHNDFYYDPATGDVTVFIASFSVVKVTVETAAPWTGGVASGFAGGDGSENNPYLIANADQLRYFAETVGGMHNGKDPNSYAGKYIKLVNNINLGYDGSETYNIFYPIGYNSDDGEFEKTGVAVTTVLKNFEGTFDGNGLTIANFYQNTWDMKGDNNYYPATEQRYRDGMGLFGRIYGGTVKNLTVENFSSDGEYTTTGVIAAYADGATFENISIINCNPRVYNIGNGGIVGCVGWYAKDANLKTTLKNITVDNTNKISALWGSWDVACGGLVGQYYPTSGQSSANYPVNGGIHMENCHVSAQIDVYNDVCANYQYYAYRYAGMLIGSVRENETIDGRVYPKMDGITASGCTVNFGNWNDYYYCELVANSLASYTHDHQFSRLTPISRVEDIQTDGDWNQTGNFIVVTSRNENGKITAIGDCVHIINEDGVLRQHLHDDGTENSWETVGGEKVLKEDKQKVYLPFNQLVTGYSWGVTSKAIDDYKDHPEQVKVNSATSAISVEKFTTDYANEYLVFENATSGDLTLGDLFERIVFTDDANKDIRDLDLDNICITVAYEKSPCTVSINLTPPANPDSWDAWASQKLNLKGIGEAIISITDYYFCKPTVAYVKLNAPTSDTIDFQNLEGSYTSKHTLADGRLIVTPRNKAEISFINDPANESNKVMKIKYPSGDWSDSYVDFINQTGAGQNFTVSIDFKIDSQFYMASNYMTILGATQSGGSSISAVKLQKIPSKDGEGNIIQDSEGNVTYETDINGKPKYSLYDVFTGDVLYNDLPKDTWITIKATIYPLSRQKDVTIIVNKEEFNFSGISTNYKKSNGDTGYSDRYFSLSWIRVGQISDQPRYAIGGMYFDNYKFSAESMVMGFEGETLEKGYTDTTFISDNNVEVVPRGNASITISGDEANKYLSFAYNGQFYDRTTNTDGKYTATLKPYINLTYKVYTANNINPLFYSKDVEISAKFKMDSAFTSLDILESNDKSEHLDGFVSLIKLVAITNGMGGGDLVRMNMVDGQMVIYDPTNANNQLVLSNEDLGKWITVSTNVLTSVGGSGEKTVTITVDGKDPVIWESSIIREITDGESFTYFNCGDIRFAVPQGTVRGTLAIDDLNLTILN